MWNNGNYLLWNHILDIYNQDLENQLHLLPRLTAGHVHLTSYSVMRVNLAVQVLSQTMSTVLSTYGSPGHKGTAEFCLKMNKFFDCTYVRSLVEGERKRKSFQKPYKSVDDERINWLQEEFLVYLRSWMNSILERDDGNYTDNAKARMFLSWQTYKGLQITVYSLIEVC